MGLLFQDYDSLIGAIDARRRELGLNLLDLDALCGFHDGYCGHLLGGRHAKTSRGLGLTSFPLICATLGLAIELVELAPHEAAQRVSEARKAERAAREREREARRLRQAKAA